jgi:hypothetical protein
VLFQVVVHEVFGTIASEEGIVQIFNGLLGEDQCRRRRLQSVPTTTTTMLVLVLVLVHEGVT